MQGILKEYCSANCSKLLSIYMNAWVCIYYTAVKTSRRVSEHWCTCKNAQMRVWVKSYIRQKIWQVVYHSHSRMCVLKHTQVPVMLHTRVLGSAYPNVVRVKTYPRARNCIYTNVRGLQKRAKNIYAPSRCNE